MTAFAGIRVLDLSRVLAGPYCAQMLADFGAEVIKVEAPGGDENRRWEPVVSGQSANFMSVNRSKKGMTLNLKSPDGQQILRELIARSDVLIESFLPDTAKALGVDPETVASISKSIVHLSVTGYGYKGPLRNRPGYDLTLQAFTGMMSVTGEPDGPPLRAGASVVDMATGMLGFSAVSAALFARASSGLGQHVQVSLLETGVALLGYHLTGFTVAGKLPSREGSGVWHLVPYQSFPTADGWILAGATNDQSWLRMCRCLGAKELEDDPGLRSAAHRIERRGEVVQALSDIFRTRLTAEWMDLLIEAKLPCSPINTIDQLVDEPQMHAMNMLPKVADAKGAEFTLGGTPIKMSRTPAGQYRVPPELGEHTRDILSNMLGRDQGEIDRLAETGAV